jgi:hypothetical protein
MLSADQTIGALSVINQDFTMGKPVFRLGEAVRTPGHGEGVIVSINRGAARGRNWREISYTIQIPGSSSAVVYYESELTKGDARYLNPST